MIDFFLISSVITQAFAVAGEQSNMRDVMEMSCESSCSASQGSRVDKHSKHADYATEL